MSNKLNVAIISSTLGVGGAEKSSAHLSFLINDLGYEVHNIIINDVVQYQYAGKLLNLGKLDKKHSKFVRAFFKGLALNSYLKKENIDIIIDNRTRPVVFRELITRIIYANRQIIYVVRSSKLSLYLSKSIFFAKRIYKLPASIVCVSKASEIKTKLEYGLKNVTTINNPVEIDYTKYLKPKELPENYFLFFGRIENEVKNLSLLIESFQLSKAKSNDFKLVIIGDGKDKQWLLDVIKDKKIEQDIVVLPFKLDIQQYIQHAYCSLLTSYFEGFPRMILESLAIGTPVISVDCETGPKELIQDGVNGLLVENYNAKAFSNAINKMMEDFDLYQNCKKNAQKSVEHLSLMNIAKQWQQLLDKKND
jgi:glycosyltransferase involved in cell wall biosynthesis